MNRIFLLVGAGGFLGSVARFYFTQFINSCFPSAFPFGTITVNVIGCLLMGFLYALAEKTGLLSSEWLIFLTIGVCGGFTTFSGFSYENMVLIQAGQYGTALLYTLASVLFCFGALFIGKSILNFF
ncbi:MAG: fluoride efflux transporter CrcB [Chitinophagales bacterium]|nr:fluoride efflux transporter CrcB [Chitinophagales bacterium]